MADTIIIKSEKDKLYCKTRISEIKPDGLQEVTFKKVSKDYTANQNRLRWLWNTELSISGIGRYDTKNMVHLAGKWQFVLPIILRDDEPDEETGEPGMFTQIYNFFMKKYQSSDKRSEHCMKFADRYIRTGDLTRQQGAESLTDFQDFWSRKGVSLTDPSMQGCDLEKMARGKK